MNPKIMLHHYSESKPLVKMDEVYKFFSLRPYLLCLGLAFIALAFGPFTNYSEIGFLDPWIYTGYFTNFKALINQFGVPYYVCRLPYILFGMLMYFLFSPLIANFLINFFILALCLCGLYYIIARFYSGFVAFLICIFFSFNAYVMSAIVWDYPDGPAIALLFAGSWFAFASPFNNAKNLSLTITGMLWGMAAYTNLIAGLVIAPAVLTLLILNYNKKNPLSWLKEGLFLLLGVFLITILFLIASQFILGTYDFYSSQFKLTEDYVLKNNHILANMWGTGNVWLKSAFRLIPVYGLIFVGMLFYTIHFKRLKEDRFFIAMLVFLTSTGVLFFITEFILHSVVLRVFYCSSYLVVPTFLFLGSLVGQYLPVSRDAGYSLKNKLLSFLVMGLVLLGTHYFPVCDKKLSWVFNSPQKQENFQSIMSAQQCLMSGIMHDRHIRFWYDKNEALSPLFDSLSSLYLWGWRDYTNIMSTLPKEELQQLFSEKTNIVHLTTNPKSIDEKNQLLLSRNIKVQEIGRWLIHSGKIEFTMVVQKIILINII